MQQLTWRTPPGQPVRRRIRSQGKRADVWSCWADPSGARPVGVGRTRLRTAAIFGLEATDRPPAHLLGWGGGRSADVRGFQGRSHGGHLGGVVGPHFISGINKSAAGQFSGPPSLPDPCLVALLVRCVLLRLRACSCFRGDTAPICLKMCISRFPVHH
jgi:hypothetical protein